MGRGQGWGLARALAAALVGWPPVVECVLVVGLAPDVGWVLAVVKDWGLDAVKACRQALLPGCV